MRNRILILALFWQLLAAPMFGQTGNQIVSAGFTPPKAMSTAPGQLVTFFVRGLRAGPAIASTLPLPTTLAGVSVSLKQGDLFSGSAPIFHIIPLDSAGLRCGPETGLLCGLTAVTVQIPFEIGSCFESPGPLSCQQLGSRFEVVATVVENGVAGEEFRLFAWRNNIHILNRCDLMAFQNISEPPRPCFPLVFRANGSLLTPSNPARAGEVVTVFAVGLGPTSPAVPSGTPSPISPARAETVGLVFLNFQPGAAPGSTGGIPAEPLFAGLTPGLVGLYQLNVKLPDQIPPDARPCGPGSGEAKIMTLTIFGAQNFDGAQICVQP